MGHCKIINNYNYNYIAIIKRPNRCNKLYKYNLLLLPIYYIRFTVVVLPLYINFMLVLSTYYINVGCILNHIVTQKQ